MEQLLWDILIHVHSNLLQIHLLEECGFHERAIEELYKKETKIVRVVIW